MIKKAAVTILWLIAAAFFSWQTCQAGMFDTVTGAINSATNAYDKAQKAGKELGLTDTTSSSQALPGGVVSRLKKAAKELDKADKALAKGSGTPADRAARAEMYLKKARSYRQEIDKRYQGKFSPDDPQVKALDRRLAATQEAISQGGAADAQAATSATAAAPATAAATGKLPSAVVSRLKKANRELDSVERVLNNTVISADARAKQADYNLKQAKYYLDEINKRYADQSPASHPQMKEVLDRYALVEAEVRQAGGQADALAAQKQQKRDAAKAAEQLSNQWIEKLKPYASSNSGKGFFPYASSEQAHWDHWNALWAELGPLWSEYQAATFSGPKSPELVMYEKTLTQKIGGYKQLSAQRNQQMQAEKALRGEILFAPKRIDPNSPKGATKNFKAGDNIYALIVVKKPWAEIYKQPKDMGVRIDVSLDGRPIHAQFITLRKPEYAQRQWLELEIAPDPDDIRAYSDPDLEYGKTTATLRQGPMELSQHLAKLPAGKHKVDLVVRYYGKTWADGSFEIQGSDFADYAELAQKAAQAVAQTTILPRAKQNNPGLADQMRQILVKAGWPDPYRINIIDKDWWINRVSGGNSAVSSRHMAAAVMAKDGSGYYYKICTFEQPRLITGGWGSLELTRTGDRVPVLEDNKDK